VPFSVAILVGMAVAAVMAAAVAAVSVRVREDQFVIASLAFQVVFFQLANNWLDLTGGPLGIGGIARPKLAGMRIDGPGGMAAFVLAVMVVVWFLLRRLLKSRFGGVIRVMREDEVLAAAFGHHVAAHKLIVFLVGGSLAALAGGLYASYMSFVDPTSFTLNESITLLAIVILGGAGSMGGAVAAAAFFVVLPEVLRFVGLPPYVAANSRQMIFGLLLVGMMLFRPRGLFGEYAFEKVRR
jgi:branched-chain amino acid transport system permease protein